MSIDNKKNDKEGEDMLAIKKENPIKNDTVYTPAKNEDVLKAIMKSSQKHSKMLNMLSK
ncbi:hypothetical protein [Ruminiclostridium sufflavum]|uniref:hypothetical protein n=1 Tax=Ruminiclostridium sufflavum TaxID=396504 RepID=UPI001403C27B|nr:hypothetical protein [Ruminiclostridium sufflavum]